MHDVPYVPAPSVMDLKIGRDAEGRWVLILTFAPELSVGLPLDFLPQMNRLVREFAASAFKGNAPTSNRLH